MYLAQAPAGRGKRILMHPLDFELKIHPIFCTFYSSFAMLFAIAQHINSTEMPPLHYWAYS